MKTILVVIALMSSISSFAGGSASVETILNLVTIDLAQDLLMEFDLDEQGDCTRVGKHFPNGGERVLPCEITGRHKLDDRVYLIQINHDGTDYKLTKLSELIQE